MKILYHDYWYSVEIWEAGMYHTDESWNDNQLHYLPEFGAVVSPADAVFMSVAKAKYIAQKMAIGGAIKSTIEKVF